MIKTISVLLLSCCLSCTKVPAKRVFELETASEVISKETYENYKKKYPNLRVISISMESFKDIHKWFDSKERGGAIKIIVQDKLRMELGKLSEDKRNNLIANLKKSTEKNNVKKIDFSHCDLYEIPKVVYQFPNLKELDLGYNRISKLPNRFRRKFRHLEILNLEENFLLQKRIKLPRCLKKVDLSYNYLKNIPLRITEYDNLEIFIIRGNKGLNNSIIKVNNIKFLNLKDCDIDKIKFTDNRNPEDKEMLEYVDLSGNKLNHLFFEGITNVQELNIRNNKKGEIEILTKNQVNIKFLYFSPDSSKIASSDLVNILSTSN